MSMNVANLIEYIGLTSDNGEKELTNPPPVQRDNAIVVVVAAAVVGFTC